jgi:hypothetical protein
MEFLPHIGSKRRKKGRGNYYSLEGSLKGMSIKSRVDSL